MRRIVLPLSFLALAGCPPGSTPTICGDGLVGLDEQCDDGNVSNGDGCSAVCASESPLCGNGVTDAGETCDDSNTTSGDGCDASCQTEAAVCGNGVREAGEQCDDGNALSKDGCSASCQTEVVEGPICNAPELKDGYVKTTCQYERLHTAGTFPLDVYTPTTPTTSAPVLFFIHGGGWSSGSRGEAEPGLSALAKQGVVGVSIDYELRPAPQIGVQNDLINSADEMDFQRDAAAAFAWAKQHLAGFGGDPNHIVVSGHSAGGHMATLLTAQRLWVTDAFVAAGLLDASQVSGFKVSSVVRGLLDLSGPIDLDRSVRNFAGFADFLITNIWAPEMLVEGSPLHHFALEQDAPPMLHTVGGGAGLVADPEGIIGAQRDYVALAQSLGFDATFIQPVFESVSFGFGFPFQDFNGSTCFSLLQHGDTAILLGQDFVPMALDQRFFETRPDVCNAQTLLGSVFVGVPGYKEAVTQFVINPEAELAWVTPGFSNRSLPNVTPSPLLIGAASGNLPAAGEAWSANPRADFLHGIPIVANQTIDTPGVTTASGDAIPEGIFDYQLLAIAGGPTLEIHAPVPPGEYRVRLYFAELFAERFVDVIVEGVTLGTNISSFNGALNKAKVVELPATITVDASFDMVLQRSANTNQIPLLAGVELVPVP